MNTLDTLGAIAGGISVGRRNVNNQRRIDEASKFLETQREHAKYVMDRERKNDADRTGLNQQMSDAWLAANNGVSGGNTEYAVNGSSFKTPQEADAYRQTVDAQTAGAMGGKPEAPLISPEVAGGATTSPLPAARGVQGVQLPDMSETPANPAAAPVPQLGESGQLDVQEIVRPKKTADALFYQGPWQQKLRAEFARVHGYEKALAMDEQLKDAAEKGYKQRVLEAAELQKAGRMREAAIKMNEIYNRDYVDGAFSNVRFIDDNTVEVVRFKPDGTIVDRTVQAMPDMITAARQILTDAQRAELLAGTGTKKWTPIMLNQQQGAMYEANSGEVQPLPPGATHVPAFGITQSVQQREADRDSRERENEADRRAADARAAAAAGRAGSFTQAQIQANKIRDAKIEGARREFNAWAAQRKAKGESTRVIPGHPMEKTYQLAKEPKTTEVK